MYHNFRVKDLQYFHSSSVAGKIKDAWYLHKQEWLFVVKKSKITCPCSKQQNYFFTQSSTHLFRKTEPGRAARLPRSLHPHGPHLQGSPGFSSAYLTPLGLSVRGRSCPLPAHRSEAGSDPTSQLYSFSDLLTATTRGCFFLLTRQKYFLFAFLGTVSLV